MIRIGRYLMEHKAAVAVIILMLTVQAFCDLSLPRYTSQIVDIGIAQSGIEHIAPEFISQTSYQKLETMLNNKDKAVLRSAYIKVPGSSSMLSLKDDASTETVETLNSILRNPMARMFYESDSYSNELSNA